jgi:hypothetical protein
MIGLAGGSEGFVEEEEEPWHEVFSACAASGLGFGYTRVKDWLWT